MVTVREFIDEGVTVLEPGMRLSIENAQELLKLIQSVSPVATPAVIVNMQHTRIVDSSGVGALVSGMKHVRGSNGRFAISNLAPELQRMFQMMNLHQIFEIYDTVELATHDLANRGI